MGHLVEWILAFLLPRAAIGAALRSYSSLERVTLALLAGVVWLCAIHMIGLVAGLPFGARQWTALGIPVALTAASNVGRGCAPSREELAIFAFMLGAAVWMLVCSVTLPVLYGGGWMGDWLEHYRRTLYFVDGTRPTGISLTARPPLFNVVAAAFAGPNGSAFASYQTTHAFLGVLAFLGATLLYCRLAKDGRPRSIALCFACLLVHPVVATNALYPWSRMLTTFCMLTGVYFYMRAHIERDARLYSPAFLALGAAVVSHFSSGTLAALIGAHWVFTVLRRKLAIGPVVSVAVAMIPTLGLWLLWSARAFGLKRTLASHATAENFAAIGWSGLVQQWGYNLATTLIPFWDGTGVARWFGQENLPGRLYDALHLYWSGTLIGSISTTLLVTLVVGRIGGGLPEYFWRKQETRFLLGLAAATFVASFLTIPNREVAGISHLALQPVALILFVTGLALVRDAKPWVGRLFVALYFLEGWLFYFLKTFDRASLSPGQLSFGYGINLDMKTKDQLLFVADHAFDLAGIIRILVLLAIPALFVLAWRELGRPHELGDPRSRPA
ncbi:MAG TPA: hypothetical protein VFQ05_08685 [Candidatus Eisenbacteria bacterium]|nr:hypothetical protein [Candidatus Eisenbacteria bacterium]